MHLTCTHFWLPMLVWVVRAARVSDPMEEVHVGARQLGASGELQRRRADRQVSLGCTTARGGGGRRGDGGTAEPDADEASWRSLLMQAQARQLRTEWQSGGHHPSRLREVYTAAAAASQQALAEVDEFAEVRGDLKVETSLGLTSDGDVSPVHTTTPDTSTPAHAPRPLRTPTSTPAHAPRPLRTPTSTPAMSLW
eukprot:CAMPEP_0181192830 /NCGR_PEP_ID=MMETSP1096-20121128/13492_1 /TAXON_ID=156174 ORGANISM="Chrysochromulina ericina, Strain CCMP281" /NCGR_SAMPLE_ID=MMETSP1096 /ASSEMBLY_ACC=CAM_ASM_000453 /LENGTH=194 /DNA_ID=CAMNT_0023282251 /DNA_START=387 /DNA_END=970 /DNA_ORIENTATION=+